MNDVPHDGYSNYKTWCVMAVFTNESDVYDIIVRDIKKLDIKTEEAWIAHVQMWFPTIVNNYGVIKHWWDTFRDPEVRFSRIYWMELAFLFEEYRATADFYSLERLQSFVDEDRSRRHAPAQTTKFKPAPEAVPDVDPVTALRECVMVDARTLKLPARRWSPELYRKVKAILEALYGRWNTQAEAFLFDEDYRPALQAILDGGELPELNPYDYYPTPDAVVEEMLAAADLSSLPNGAAVLEPSAGQGAIVRHLLNRGLHIHAVEFDPRNFERLEKLRALAAPDGQCYLTFNRDFLKHQCNIGYDLVLMNPPFTSDSDRQAYIAHITHAYTLLRPGGRLVAIAPSGVKSGNTKKVTAFRKLVEQQGYIRDLPDNSFEESGTGVSTVLIYMERGDDLEPEPFQLDPAQMAMF